jgi:hypothetical protein
MKFARICTALLSPLAVGLMAAVMALAPVAASASSSADLSAGHLVASGTVVSTTGQAMPDATVHLYAWPQSEVLQHLKIGQQVPTVLLASATAGASGRYALAIKPGALKPYANSGGYANLEIMAGMSVYDFAVLASAPSVTQIPALKASPDTPADCTGWELYQHMPRSTVTVLSGYIVGSKGTKGDTYNGNYTNGASSSLAVGVSDSGDVGSFHATGTNSQSASGSIGYPPLQNSGYQNDRTQFQVTEFENICGGGIGKIVPANHCNPQWTCAWKVEATGWVGDGSAAPAKSAFKHPGWTCAGPYTAGEKFTTTRAKAITWSKGFTVADLDFSGSSQTGYSSSAQLVYHFAKTGEACGSNDVPAKATEVLTQAWP